MRTMGMMFATILALSVVAGCGRSRGGGISKGEGFRLITADSTMEITQGDRKTVTVSLAREGKFKRDVTLQATTDPGLTVEPNEVYISASSSPDVQLQIKAHEDAALGDYRLQVTATPEAGRVTSTEIMIQVVSP